MCKEKTEEKSLWEDVLYIVIPAYNEEENIKTVIDDWYPVVEQHNANGKSRLVIIDDGSKDATYEMMQEYAKDRPYLQPVTKENAGHGATVLYGYHYALKNRADYVFQTDSDGQTLPEEFPQFWELRDQYDMIIGHRNKREDGGLRVFVTKVLKLVVQICFDVTVTDANTPYRLMKADVLREEIKYEPKDFNLSNVLLSVLYAKHDRTMKFIPITFRQRQGGTNSINMRRIFAIGKQAWKDFRAINRSLKV